MLSLEVETCLGKHGMLQYGHCIRLVQRRSDALEQIVSVIETNGEEALVRGVRASACGNCAGQSSCSTFGSWFERFAEMRVENRIGAKAGDQVIVEVADVHLLRATFRLYGVPMLIFIGVGLLAQQLALNLGLPSPDLWAVLAGTIGMAARFFWMMRFSQNPSAPLGRIVKVERRCVIPLKPI